MLDINAQAARAAMPFDHLIPALRNLFAIGCEVPLRHNHTIQKEGQDHGTVLLMPAWSEHLGYFGIKTVSIFPKNSAQGLPGLFSTYMLHSMETGEPLALIDGNEITSRRTAAASALAADHLCRKDASRMLLIGAGRVASLVPYAYRSVRNIESVSVWDINEAASSRLVETLRRDGFDARVVDTLDHAAFGVDIVSAATLSTEPLVLRKYLRPGTHVDLIGSFTPTMRESDDGCFDGTSVYVDTDEAPMKSGDLLSPIQKGVLRREQIRADLTSLCRAENPGRISEEEITVFKAVGTALEDLAAAAMCYRALQC
ncbi:ornithine cyclodeaminase [Comamonas sp. BIGb0124]|uniref:ornithine cyclodeaminase family protein n=1 Tax=Comamonas sp. BIGb0124 TaxID=2485130 RepID=UPI000F48CDFA|nr:ornithine cyclodeaminase family protein [Comamonas sp. BIGb0124]ROR26581.1 ornithine cyclodeaminase [Comamonas sp. BIGb0124]